MEVERTRCYLLKALGLGRVDCVRSDTEFMAIAIKYDFATSSRVHDDDGHDDSIHFKY